MVGTGLSVERHRGLLLLEEVALLVVFALVVLAVDPRGDLPLNDDWNFALGTWWFAEHGEFRFARFTGMSLRAQVIWGALWTKAFGESFEVLRASSLTLAAACIVMFHGLISRTSLPSAVRIVASLAFLSSPFFIWSAHTYMTQIPFLAATLGALYAWTLGAEKRSIAWFLTGSVAAIVSCFVRQSGVAAFVAGAALLLVVWRSSERRFRVGAGLSLGLSTILVAYLLMETTLLHGRPEEFALRLGLFDQGLKAGIRKLLLQSAVSFSFIMLYATLAVLGLAVALAWQRADRRLVAMALVAAIPLTWGASTMSSVRGPLPYNIHGNIMMGAGLGPPTLRDVWVFRYPVPRPLPIEASWVLAVVVVIIASLALAWLARRIMAAIHESSERDRLVWAGGMGLMAAGTAILFTTDIIFDRYALDAAWSLALVLPLATRWTRARLATAGALTIAILIFSAAATSDYLAWNRARWEAFERLRERGVTLEQMDGGYEINQYLLGGFDGPAMLVKGQFSVVDDEWILSFHEVRGYRTVDRVDYARWSGNGTIFIQQRTTGFTAEFALEERE
jgi:hypothetical protein